jgi:benzoate membrane transport protein
VVAASGTVIGGIGAAFWALLAGLVVRAVLTRRVAADSPPTSVRKSH